MGNLERPKPKDSITFSGPAQCISTYGQYYPGHKGMNQYVKPTDQHRRANFPLSGKTIYSTEFILKKRSISENAKEPDHFKTGMNLMGDNTTYNKNFNAINPEDIIMVNSFKPT